jgi:peptidoglycan/LPS O-acetylase OafA/YrhL
MTSITEDDAILERPKRVTAGVQVLLASLALGTITAAVHVFRNAVGTSMVLALLIVLAFFALGFLLVWRIAARKNWARIILLVLVAVGTPLAVPGYIASLRQNMVPGALSIFISILQLIGTFLLFTGKSNPWFRKRK